MVLVLVRHIPLVASLIWLAHCSPPLRRPEDYVRESPTAAAEQEETTTSYNSVTADEMATIEKNEPSSLSLSKCELAKKLWNGGRTFFPREELAFQTCMAGIETLSPDGEEVSVAERVVLDRGYQPLYGVFGLQGGYWCDNGINEGPNYCKMPCDKLLDDDFSDDIKCAFKVLARKGVNGWLGRKYQCCRNDLWKTFLVQEPGCLGDEEEEEQVLPGHICEVSRNDIRLQNAYRSGYFDNDFGMGSMYRRANDYVKQDMCKGNEEYCAEDAFKCEEEMEDEEDRNEKCLNHYVIKYYSFESQQIT